MNTQVKRRERLRQELSESIKAAALRQLAESGPQAVTLRGIARELGVSPGALYGYFDSLDDLYSALIADGFNAQAQYVEDAIAFYNDRGHPDRMFAAMMAYRLWAVDHPELFRLLYFSPIPGYVAHEDGPTHEAALRVSVAFLSELAREWERSGVEVVCPGPRVDVEKFATIFGLKITPDQLRSAVGCWGEFHGLVCLEIAGHVDAQWTEPEALYDATIRGMTERMGGSAPAADITASVLRKSLSPAPPHEDIRTPK